MNKTILLPNWMVDHGIYFTAGALTVLVLIILAAVWGKYVWSAAGFLLMAMIVLTVPNAHEYRSSNLNGILGQAVLLISYAAFVGLILHEVIDRLRRKRTKL